MGDDRSDGSAAAGDGGHAAISLTPAVNGMYLFILKVHYFCLCGGDLLYIVLISPLFFNTLHD